MDWHPWLGSIAGVGQALAVIPYVKDVLRGTTRPNIVSWSLWTLAVLITLAAQITAGASWPALILVGATVANVTVIVLALFGYGYTKFGTVEWICLFLSLAALIFWRITEQPLVAIGFAITADCIAYIPTLVKTYKDPFSETAVYWLLLVVTDLMAIASTTLFNAANLAFPIYYASINTVLFGLIIFGQRFKKALK
jgi:hypothetical protein